MLALIPGEGRTASQQPTCDRKKVAIRLRRMSAGVGAPAKIGQIPSTLLLAACADEGEGVSNVSRKAGLAAERHGKVEVVWQHAPARTTIYRRSPEGPGKPASAGKQGVPKQPKRSILFQCLRLCANVRATSRPAKSSGAAGDTTKAREVLRRP